MPYTCDGETKFNPHNDVVALWTEHSLCLEHYEMPDTLKGVSHKIGPVYECMTGHNIYISLAAKTHA